jgi:hypothetical protein
MISGSIMEGIALKVTQRAPEDDITIYYIIEKAPTFT